MAEALSPTPDETVADPRPGSRSAWTDLTRTPRRVRLFLAVVAVAALVLPWTVEGPADEHPTLYQLLTAAVLVTVSVLNVEFGRFLTGGLEHAHQPHKALSAWAFACALSLPTPWLLAVVPLTYLHARWRGIRIPLWKWAGSAAFLVVAATAAAFVSEALMGRQVNWMLANGGRGLAAALAAAATFLVVESVLFWAIAHLNHAADEEWLRHTLRTGSFYGTEAGVLLIGALLSAVWSGGPWFVLIFGPIYAMAQRAALHEPLREQAETATQLAEKNAELERANRFKSDLMGMLGHEIGNPLTSVVGYSQVGLEALDDGDPAFARESFRVVERSAGQVQGVLNEILTLVASDGGVLSAVPERCAVGPHLTAAAATQPPGQRPPVECPDGLVALVQPRHLDQMLANLLSNARKYAGGATLLRACPAPDGAVEIAVVDAGPGVPAAFRADVFDRFSRHEPTTRGVGGTGLGLFITRELARANEGDVTHQDAEPTGSVFTIRLPAG